MYIFYTNNFETFRQQQKFFQTENLFLYQKS
ncbi:Uncharacterised protein [Acinetobacter phage MD-2021a]|uniref:Uncharacterized protein n=1 Tax=Acinetobacter baumannii TaxID=470 RepID=A0A154DQT3_ACIBA|nr:hypothetical protein F979_02197 [Acinetobacter baumannii NIPH 146]ENU69131.1 hypothetical protein F978_02248 [Acinetobacter baumannii NIPH 615]KZA17858.1 hypothetical protein LV35_01763 [Acinetobacter baumannii]CAH1083380.1 Uncharacterised protein [Acinetobacter phage MD-2021a]CDG78704.1 hypothetical protein ABICBIBUN_08810 [Acinetobacter baumannii 107m]CDM72071.1 hypothetical protein ABP630_1618 [Acinetobacter baumannii P630]